MENIQKLLCEMRVDFFVLLKIQDKRNKRLHHSKPFKCSWSLAFGVLRMRNACGIICKYNWIDYTIIKLVHKIMWILKLSRGFLANQNADSE